MVSKIGLFGARRDKGIVVREHTEWRKTEIAVLAYFAKNHNRPSTYRDIARAYISSSYSNYQKACENLVKKSYLRKLEDGNFKVIESKWTSVKEGVEKVRRDLPYFQSYLKQVRRVK
ncbi:MAG: hypothetical protein OQK82_08300 [Candidatus Pacearchaeota archaeon]|nr:hypothetical protein [Candidatus Pacearchaeota archaeon]